MSYKLQGSGSASDPGRNSVSALSTMLIEDLEIWQVDFLCSQCLVSQEWLSLLGI